MLRQTLERGCRWLSSSLQCPQVNQKEEEEEEEKAPFKQPTPQILPGILVLFSETHNNLLRFWPPDKLSFEARQSDLQGALAWER